MDEAYEVEDMEAEADITYMAEFTEADRPIRVEAVFLNGSNHDEISPIVILRFMLCEHKHDHIEFERLPIEHVFEYAGEFYNINVVRGD
jgi:hypothetical protein